MIKTPLQEQEIFLLQTHAGVGQTHAGVGQDKKPPGRFTAGMSEPVTATGAGETATDQSVTVLDLADNRQKHHGSETRQSALIAGRVPLHIKAEVNRIGKLKGWTESYTVRTLVEQALAKTIAEQFGVMIRQTIQEAVRQEFQIYTNRMGKLTFSAYLAAEQGRLLEIENLRYALDQKDIGTLSQKIKSIRQQAWDNLKLYNYSITDVEKAASEAVPWQ
jgi:hypothetical protein